MIFCHWDNASTSKTLNTQSHAHRVQRPSNRDSISCIVRPSRARNGEKLAIRTYTNTWTPTTHHHHYTICSYQPSRRYWTHHTTFWTGSISRPRYSMLLQLKTISDGIISSKAVSPNSSPSNKTIILEPMPPERKTGLVGSSDSLIPFSNKSGTSGTCGTRIDTDTTYNPRHRHRQHRRSENFSCFTIHTNRKPQITYNGYSRHHSRKECNGRHMPSGNGSTVGTLFCERVTPQSWRQGSHAPGLHSLQISASIFHTLSRPPPSPLEASVPFGQMISR